VHPLGVSPGELVPSSTTVGGVMPASKTLIVDTGASGHYFPLSHLSLLYDIASISDTADTQIQLPNGTLMSPTHSGFLRSDVPLPKAALKVFVFPELQHALLSIALLCEHKCTAAFTNRAVYIYLNDNLIFTGFRNVDHTADPLRDLWTLAFPVAPCLPDASQNARQPIAPALLPAVHATKLLNNLVHHQSNAELVAFYHAAMGSPAIPTFMAAVQNGWIRPRGLTVDMVRKNVPNSLSMSQGHLKQHRQGLHSTGSATVKPKLPLGLNATSSEEIALRPEPFLPTKTLFTKVLQAKEFSHRNHADATGRFPVTSRQGSNYMLLFYCEDTGYIHIVPLASRTKSEYLRAFRLGLQFFQFRGFKPNVQRLDNEVSFDLLDMLKREFDIMAELAPPSNHRSLLAERGIQTWKDHFIATLCTTDRNFPLSCWEDLVDPAESYLNLMRAATCDPTKSAFEVVRGPHDMNRHPLLPLGMLVLIHDSVDKRRSWDPHGVPGYYLGPAAHHYRCFNVWSPTTNGLRISDSLSWHPTNVNLPGSRPSELVIAAVDDLIAALHLCPPASGQQDSATTVVITNLTANLRDLQNIYASSRPEVRDNPTTSQPGLVTFSTDNNVAGSEPISSLPLSPLGTPPLAIPVSTINVLPPLTTTVQPSSSPPTRSRRKPTRYALTTCAIFDKSKLSDTSPSPSEPIFPQRTKGVTPARNPSTAPPPIIPQLRYSTLLKGPDSELWEAEHTKELIRLLETTKVMRFCSPNEKPASQKAKYYRIVCKAKINPIDGSATLRVRGTVADTHSDYPGPTAAYTATYKTINLLFNAVVSEDAGWMTADIEDYYLGTPLKHKHYMWIPLRVIPHVIQSKYNLLALDQSKSVMVEISGGMYGLAEAGRLAQDRLIAHLDIHGYYEAVNTPCLFKHRTRSTIFSLVVDDFGIKYRTQTDADHLLATLRLLYNITVDVTGSQYLGMTILYNKSLRIFQTSMPGAVSSYLKRYQFTPLVVSTDAPSQYTSFKYGSGHLDALPVDSSPLLDAARTTRLQSIVGSFQHYARVIDVTMLCPISKLATARKSEATERAVDHFMHYAATWPNPVITYHPSNMVLQVHSDASYLSETEARSRAGGYHFSVHIIILLTIHLTVALKT